MDRIDFPEDVVKDFENGEKCSFISLAVPKRIYVHNAMLHHIRLSVEWSPGVGGDQMTP